MPLTTVVRFSSFGDIVLCGAVTGGLAPVRFVTLPRYAELAALLPGVVEVVRWDVDPLPAPTDTVVDLHASPRSIAVAPTLGKSVRRVARQDLLRRMRVALKVQRAPIPVVERYARAAGVARAERPWMARPDGPRDALVLAPGAAHATKRWPHFAALAAQSARPVVVLGGPGEEALAGRIAAAHRAGVSVAGAPLPRQIEVLGRARAAVTGDTGLGHLCAAAGVPTAVLFGPTVPSDGYFAPPATVHPVERALACRPCSRYGGATCPIGDHACLRDLDVATVARIVEDLCASSS